MRFLHLEPNEVLDQRPPGGPHRVAVHGTRWAFPGIGYRYVQANLYLYTAQVPAEAMDRSLNALYTGTAHVIVYGAGLNLLSAENLRIVGSVACADGSGDFWVPMP